MTARQSSAVDRALAEVSAGRKTAYRAALDEGLALSTIYRAIKRLKAAKPPKGAKGRAK
jgi:hypothetical protein